MTDSFYKCIKDEPGCKRVQEQNPHAKLHRLAWGRHEEDISDIQPGGLVFLKVPRGLLPHSPPYVLIRREYKNALIDLEQFWKDPGASCITPRDIENPWDDHRPEVDSVVDSADAPPPPPPAKRRKLLVMAGCTDRDDDRYGKAFVISGHTGTGMYP